MRVLALGIALAVATTAVAARAEGPGEIVVVLTDGTQIEGRIEEIVPEDHCTLHTKDGLRTVPWRTIKRIGGLDLAGASATPSSSTSSSPSLPTEPPPPSAMVLVTLDAAPTVRLEMSVAGGPWEKACTAPCGVELPVDASYRALDGDKQLQGFRLKANGHEKVKVDVSTGSTAARVLGVIGVIGGTIAAYVALVAGSNSSSSSKNSDAQVPVILLGLGVAIGGGIAIGVSGVSVNQQAGGRVTASRKVVHGDLVTAPRVLEPPSRVLSAPIFTVRF